MPRSRNRRRKRTRRKKGGQDKPLKKLGAHCSRHMFTHGECDEGLTCYKNMCVHDKQQEFCVYLEYPPPNVKFDIQHL